jgi:acetyl-CoA carboxylase, biotin carboxylase subunit
MCGCRCIDETVIVGVPTTLPYHKLIMQHPKFVDGIVDTGFIAKHGDELVKPEEGPKDKRRTLVADASKKKR